MYKSAYVHYKNKYPGGQVQVSDNTLDVYCAENMHRVALRKGGDGMWHDLSDELGADDRHCMAPLPLEAKAFEECPKTGNVIKCAAHGDKKKNAEGLAINGRVPSIKEQQLIDANPELAKDYAELHAAANPNRKY